MITPLNCLVEMSKTVEAKIGDIEQRKKLKLMQNTVELLLNQVRSNLDASLLDKNILRPNLQQHSV